MLHIVKREHLYNDQDSRITSIQSDEDTLVLYSSSNSRTPPVSARETNPQQIPLQGSAWPGHTHTWLTWLR